MLLQSVLVGAMSALVAAQEPELKLKTWEDALDLEHEFSPIMPAYWTNLPHHRRTPFDISPDGKTGYIAYLDASGEGVHVQHVDPHTMEPKPPLVTIPNVREAGGIVAHNHGFALLGNEPIPSSTQDAPPEGTPVPAIYRYEWGQQLWKTFVAGPGVHEEEGLMMSPDMNGDLVWSEESGLYGAYFVVTAYTGSFEGHFGDSVQYVNDDGELQVIEGASSSWGCSHNTGIALEAASEPPFASLCAEDQGAIWLNTKGQGMSLTETKMSNENTTNGGGGEAMGGMSGSYSSLAKFQNSTEYIFAWVSRGAVDLSLNDWMSDGYTHSQPRTEGRRAAMAILSDKETKLAPEATSEVGAASGDDQVNWLSPAEGPDRSNAHVATFDDTYALVSWEEALNPECTEIAMGCAGEFSGTYFQLVNNVGARIGEPIKRSDTFVAGDMATMDNGDICWPYVNMEWSLSEPVGYGGSDVTTQKMSFACMSLV